MKKYRTAFFLILVGLLALGIRLSFFDILINYDEAVSGFKPLAEKLSHLFGHTNHFFYEILVSSSLALLGMNYVAIRLPSLLMGMGLLLVVYQLGKEIEDSFTGLGAAIIISLCYPFVYYSIRSEGYSLYAVLATLSLVTAFRLNRRPTRSEWLRLTLLLVLGGYTIPTFAIPAAIILSWVAWEQLSNRSKSNTQQVILPLIICISAGLLLISVLYLPVFIHEGFNSFTKNPTYNPPGTAHYWPSVWLEIQILFEWWGGNQGIIVGVLTAGSGLIGLIVTKPAVRSLMVVTSGWIVVCLALLPTAAPARIWLFLLPLVAVMALGGIRRLLRLLPAKSLPGYENGALVLLALGYGLVQFPAIHALSNEPRMEQGYEYQRQIRGELNRASFVFNPYRDNRIHFFMVSGQIEPYDTTPFTRRDGTILLVISPGRSIRAGLRRIRGVSRSELSVERRFGNKVGKILRVEPAN